jgi:hypothetical protein
VSQKVLNLKIGAFIYISAADVNSLFSFRICTLLLNSWLDVDGGVAVQRNIELSYDSPK